MESAKVVKEQGKPNDLIDRIKADKKFSAVADKVDEILKPENFVGRAKDQVDEFLGEYIKPLLDTESFESYKPDIKV